MRLDRFGRASCSCPVGKDSGTSQICLSMEILEQAWDLISGSRSKSYSSNADVCIKPKEAANTRSSLLECTIPASQIFLIDLLVSKSVSNPLEVERKP